MRFLISIILIINTSTAFAQLEKTHSCSNSPQKKSFSSIKNITQSIPKTCPSLEELSKKEALQNYEKYFPKNSKQITKNYGPYSLKGSEAEHRHLKEILGKDPLGWPQIAKNCETIVCALGKSFSSEEAALRVLTIAERNGYHLKMDRSDFNYTPPVKKLWTSNEVKSLDEVFKRIPPELNNLKNLENIKRIPDGKENDFKLGKEFGVAKQAVFNGTQKTHDGILMLSSHAFKSSPKTEIPRAEYTLIHELCHHIDYAGYYSKSKEPNSTQDSWGFRKISWKKTNKTEFSQIRDDNFVSDYAKTDPLEDFAESCAKFITQPEELKQASEDKYELIKNKVFHGKTFEWPTPLERQSWPEVDLLAESSRFCTDVKTCIGSKYGILVKATESVDTAALALKKYKSKDSADFSIISADELWQTDPCFKNIKTKIIADIDKELNSRADYCQKGGLESLNNNISNPCFSHLKKQLVNIEKNKNKSEKALKAEDEALSKIISNSTVQSILDSL